jgi:hypothetical protein
MEPVIDPNAPVAPAPEAAPAPAPEKSTKERATDSFVGVFMDKLKEQGFTVMLMCGILYYQHQLWQNERAELIKEIDQKEERIIALVEREHSDTKARESALREKRDQFVEMLKEQATRCNAAR